MVTKYSRNLRHLLYSIFRNWALSTFKKTSIACLWNNIAKNAQVQIGGPNWSGLLGVLFWEIMWSCTKFLNDEAYLILAASVPKLSFKIPNKKVEFTVGGASDHNISQASARSAFFVASRSHQESTKKCPCIWKNKKLEIGAPYATVDDSTKIYTWTSNPSIYHCLTLPVTKNLSVYPKPEPGMHFFFFAKRRQWLLSAKSFCVNYWAVVKVKQLK